MRAKRSETSRKRQEWSAGDGNLRKQIWPDRAVWRLLQHQSSADISLPKGTCSRLNSSCALPYLTFIPKATAVCTRCTNLAALLCCLISYHSPGQKLLVLPKARQYSSCTSFPVLSTKLKIYFPVILALQLMSLTRFLIPGPPFVHWPIAGSFFPVPLKSCVASLQSLHALLFGAGNHTCMPNGETPLLEKVL